MFISFCFCSYVLFLHFISLLFFVLLKSLSSSRALIKVKLRFMCSSFTNCEKKKKKMLPNQMTYTLYGPWTPAGDCGWCLFSALCSFLLAGLLTDPVCLTDLSVWVRLSRCVYLCVMLPRWCSSGNTVMCVWLWHACYEVPHTLYS